MEKIKRFLVLWISILFLLPSALAELNISIAGKEVYNWGEVIRPSVTVKEDQDHNGFFILNVICERSRFEYYTAPLNIEKGFRTQVNVPDLTLFDPISGNCKLRAEFEKVDGERVNYGWSQNFFVSNELDIITDENLDAKPGDEVLITGTIKKLSSELMQKGEAEINFKNEKILSDISFGKFEHKISLDKDMETGVAPITLVIRGSFGNFGEKTINLNIIQVPKKIENDFERNVLTPGSDLRVKVTLFDQSQEIIKEAKIRVKVFDPEENLIAEDEVDSRDFFDFFLDSYQAPGNYFLLSTSGDIREQSSFIVETMRKISMRNEGNDVVVENTGNVNYEDDVTLILDSGSKDVLVNKKIKLQPGEIMVIDLSREAAAGTYDISDQGGEFRADNVVIEDNRPLSKRSGEGLSAITGTLISTAGFISSRPFLASTILVIIILGTVIHYSKGFFSRRLKGKRKDTEELFKDFKYDK
jgi:hypothetical protein